MQYDNVPRLHWTVETASYLLLNTELLAVEIRCLRSKLFITDSQKSQIGVWIDVKFWKGATWRVRKSIINLQSVEQQDISDVKQNPAKEEARSQPTRLRLDAGKSEEWKK